MNTKIWLLKFLNLNKQKEFLLKLQQDKEALERHMRENDAVMATRM